MKGCSLGLETMDLSATSSASSKVFLASSRVSNMDNYKGGRTGTREKGRREAGWEKRKGERQGRRRDKEKEAEGEAERQTREARQNEMSAEGRKKTDTSARSKRGYAASKAHTIAAARQSIRP